MVAISTLTLSALALGAHVSLAAPSRAQPTLSPRNHVEKRALSSWLTLLKDSVVSDVACATSCVSWLADAALCAGESTLTDSTYLGCMCETDNLAAWVSCASCYVDHMTDGTQQQTTFQNLESGEEAGPFASPSPRLRRLTFTHYRLPLRMRRFAAPHRHVLGLHVHLPPIFTASGTLPIYTATATGNPETLTQATQTTSSSETSSTSTTESSPSSTTLSSSTSESTTTESSTSTSSSADLSPFTVTSTTSQGAPTGSSAQTGASGAAAGVATAVVVESGAGRVAVALGALLVGALALII